MGPVWQSPVVCGWGLVSFSFSFRYNLPPHTHTLLSSQASRFEICLCN